MIPRFVEFVLMQAQQAALCLGRFPNPSTGKSEVNLPVARMFIDHLEMMREKTRGNLTREEEQMLASVLADLQLGFVEASAAAPVASAAPTAGDAPQPAAGASPQGEGAAETAGDSEESKKRFSKSYG